MRKTTKIRFCKVPKGTNRVSLMRNGRPIEVDDLEDVFTDSVKSPTLLCVLQKNQLIRTGIVKGNDGENVPVHIISSGKLVSMSTGELFETLSSDTTDDTSMEELERNATAILGIRYILQQANQFGVDVVVIEGNSVNDQTGPMK